MTPMKITMDGKYTTRDGRPVRVLATDIKHEYPVVFAYVRGDRELVGVCYADGRASTEATTDCDLIEAPKPPREWWQVRSKQNGNLCSEWVDRGNAEIELETRTNVPAELVHVREVL
jgi:hypothetical protein